VVHQDEEPVTGMKSTLISVAANSPDRSGLRFPGWSYNRAVARAVQSTQCIA
jgi:hypothetical protein